MEEIYSIKYITKAECNIAGFKDFLLIKFKTKFIIWGIMAVIFVALVIYETVCQPLHGFAKLIYAIVFVVPMVNFVTMKYEYDDYKKYFKENSGNEYIFHIYDNGVKFEKEQNDKEPLVISFSDKTLIAKNKKDYFLIYALPTFCVIPKESLSEADKNALAELTEKINNMPREELKAAERSGQ